MRILAILADTPDIVFVARNRADFEAIDMETKEDILPVAVLLDGKEEVLRIPQSRADGESNWKLINLLPQIFVVLKPTNDVKNTGQGEKLSQFRVDIMRALEDDQELDGLLGANGGVVYKGMDTDFQTGSSIQGQMLLEFAFVYRLDPAELRS